jgi:hypothetical protein
VRPIALSVSVLLTLTSGLLGCHPDDSLPPGTTVLSIRVTEQPGGTPLPARLLLYGPTGDLLHVGALDYEGRAQQRGFCTLPSGAVGTWDGIALAYGQADLPVGQSYCDTVPAIPYGRYRLEVVRDAEHELWSASVDLSPNRGRVVVDAPLQRAFSTTNATDVWVTADLHVHAEGSPDSHVPRPVRVISEAAAGITVIGSSDHNRNGDFQDEIAELHMEPFVASLPGNEVSVGVGHFNVFPAFVDRAHERGGAPAVANLSRMSARALFAQVHGWPGRPLVQVNHARLGFAAYFDQAGWNGTSWPPPMPVEFDAIEVLNGFLAYSQAADRKLERQVGDFYTLYRHGALVTPLGNSDTHGLNLILAGFPRSYVRVRDARTQPFDSVGFIEALRGRHTVATTGPWLDVRAGTAGPGDAVRSQGGTVALSVTLRQASFVRAARIRIRVGDAIWKTVAVPAGATRFNWRGAVPTAGSTFIGVEAAGDEPLPPELVGEYLNSKGGMVPFALASPILVDGGPAAEMTGFDMAPRAAAEAFSGYDCGEGPM